MARFIDLKIGDVIQIGDAEVRLQFKKGQTARLEIVADQSVKINHRRMSATDLKNTEQYTHGKHTL